MPEVEQESLTDMRTDCSILLASALLAASCALETASTTGHRHGAGGDCDNAFSHTGHPRQSRPAAASPFEEIPDYIASLDRGDRSAWQRPDAVIDALDLVGDELLADVGAGSGYFAFRIAEHLPWGSVLALDPERGMVEHVRERAAARGARNVSATVIDPETPRLPAGVHVVFVCNVLHYVADRRSWLCGIASQLDPGALVVLIGFDEDAPEGGPAPDRRLSQEEIRAHACAAGLAPVADHSELLPLQFFLVFSKW